MHLTFAPLRRIAEEVEILLCLLRPPLATLRLVPGRVSEGVLSKNLHLPRPPLIFPRHPLPPWVSRQTKLHRASGRDGWSEWRGREGGQRIKQQRRAGTGESGSVETRMSRRDVWSVQVLVKWKREIKWINNAKWQGNQYVHEENVNFEQGFKLLDKAFSEGAAVTLSSGL